MGQSISALMESPTATEGAPADESKPEGESAEGSEPVGEPVEPPAAPAETPAITEEFLMDDKDVEVLLAPDLTWPAPGFGEKISGLVLQSTFTSIPDVGAELFPWLPVRTLSTIRYDTRSRLPQLKLPVLVMHSRADELAAFHHAERNFVAANQPKLFWEITGGHNDAVEDRDHFIAGVEKFLQLIEAPKTTP